MIRKVYKTGHEARKAIVKGMNFAADQILLTQGPSGRNALLGRAYQYSELTNDGKTIAEDIYLDDEIEQLGVERVKIVATTVFDKGGDNTTTAVNLLKAFTNKGMELLEPKSVFAGSTEDPISVRNKIYTAAKEICQELDKDIQPVETIEDMERVAFAATENKEHAKMIAEMFNVIGKDGIVTYEDSYDELVTSEVVEGFEIEAGLSSEILSNQEDKKTFILDDPLVLVTNVSIDFKDKLVPLTKSLDTQGIQQLIVVADNFSPEVLHSFIESKLSNSFNIIGIKAPYFGKTASMQDIAVALGAHFFDKESNKLAFAVKENLGTAKRIIVTKDKATFLKPNGNTKERIAEIKKEIKENKSKFDQEQLKKRLAKLSGGVGVIKIGSDSSTHTGYLKKKLLNGCNSVKSSLNGGAIKGGGFTLIQVSDRLKENLLAQAICSPFEQIQKNAGGYLKIGDNVLDPAINIKAAIMTAAREAGDILTIEFANADKREEPKDYKLEE